MKLRANLLVIFLCSMNAAMAHVDSIIDMEHKLAIVDVTKVDAAGKTKTIFKLCESDMKDGKVLCLKEIRVLGRTAGYTNDELVKVAGVLQYKADTDGGNFMRNQMACVGGGALVGATLGTIVFPVLGTASGTIIGILYGYVGYATYGIATFMLGFDDASDDQKKYDLVVKNTNKNMMLPKNDYTDINELAENLEEVLQDYVR